LGIADCDANLAVLEYTVVSAAEVAIRIEVAGLNPIADNEAVKAYVSAESIR
jgi:hypothetical protein